MTLALVMGFSIAADKIIDFENTTGGFPQSSDSQEQGLQKRHRDASLGRRCCQGCASRASASMSARSENLICPAF